MSVINYVDKLNSWFKKFKRYTVSYKKGFYHLSNLANSPHTIIESFDKMPFCKHHREKKLMTADSMFIKAQLYYYELEEGLIIFVSDLTYKKNLSMTNIYDKSLPMNHHFINLHYREKSIKSKSMLVNGVLLTDKTWTSFKAGNAISDYHFKDSNEKNITIYFTEKWLTKQFGSVENGIKFAQFIQSDNTYLLIADADKKSDTYYEKFLDLTTQDDTKKKHSDLDSLTTQFFEDFYHLLNKENFNEDHYKLSDKDRKFIQRTERILLDNLLSGFPGIESIADKIGISPTKLKKDFKTIHNKSLYQFYSTHQMHLAHKLITKNIHPIKEVSKVLGYDNASKFTARFKEEFGVLPSEI